MELLRLEGVCAYIDGRPLFEGVDLRLSHGEKLVVTAPSGTGKTTLIRCIMGFVDFSGRILVGGRELTPESAPAVRREISYVPQNTAVFTGNTARCVREVLESRHNRKRADEALFKEVLEELGPGQKALEKAWEELSGGERQRVLFALSVALKRPLMLLDEPTSSLDEASAKKLAFTLKKLECAALVVSHQKSLWEEAGFKLWRAPWAR